MIYIHTHTSIDKHRLLGGNVIQLRELLKLNNRFN